MVQTRLANLRRKADRALELAPEVLREPRRIASIARGLHPATLIALDQPWIRDIVPDVVLDVGANTGQFAAVALHVFPDTQVVSFEPLPECISILRGRLGDIDRFLAVPAAIGSENATITINRSASSPSSSILKMNQTHADAFPWTAVSEPVDVSLRTLDSLWKDLDLSGRALLKIDVQGYGLEVLKGATSVLEIADIVMIEVSFEPLYDGEASFDEIYAMLRTAGFRFVGLLDSLTHPTTRQPLQGDAIFRR